ncbi:3-hydroxyacyl-CoA dehydrogenase family protein [Megasphaera paucivorans]|uniref:3-hydroxybutyryl-CoA dehydrogenase n=1 Tax=Megasphaera paucivorans TaxID=349095 RepID=A0A1G9YNS4_9FIRM|nr:3-hydroxyacyl-CoA dehydrogenase family protein [Megasphaera paucivorans]SDN10231.1 3-hydroxybutyryl-CoA dehydrogenase [Megasphaera paucivorans]
MTIKNILIYGAGLMGRGIAQVYARNPEYKVFLYDIVDNDTICKVKSSLEDFAAKGVMSQKEASAQLNRIAFQTELTKEFCQKIDLVVEAVFENMELKQGVFEKLEDLCREDTIFCTNTSVMSPTQIGKKLKEKRRFVGTHFWNPAQLIPLVEIVKADGSSDETAQTVLHILEGVGKKPVICQKDVPGFIANRMQHALWREAIHIVEAGIADAETVDKAVKYSFGLRLPQLPPLVNSDMVGTDLTYNIHEYILQYLCNDTKPSPVIVQMKKNGKLGFKSGEGFFKWDEASIKKENDDLNKYLIKMLYQK